MFSRILRSLYNRASSLHLLEQNRLFRPKWPTSCASAAMSVATCKPNDWPPQARPRTASQCVEWQTMDACASLWKGFGLSSYFRWIAEVKRLMVCSLHPSSPECGTTIISAIVSSERRPVRSWSWRQSRIHRWSSPDARRLSTSATMLWKACSCGDAPPPLSFPSLPPVAPNASLGLGLTPPPSWARHMKSFRMKRTKLLLSLRAFSGVFAPKSWLVSTLTSPSTLANLLSTRLKRSCAWAICVSRCPPRSYSETFCPSKIFSTAFTSRCASYNGGPPLRPHTPPQRRSRSAAVACSRGVISS
mmetsp:Transcript_123459/g.343932  ORF Transcript_123459/g.343932 Transcript_123459/m.343932 type:complete len:303 (+) Transcript_123459:996-1904(+)